ncbi:hypothetical protein QYE76_015387 [Lolium multiflorum]|uniref:Uncharacterized protein n=1 Tax=Lolium multiflorum TaxID=4521 RepID=A0AAD8X7P9_LOLMU|nr:hypothetical protein QYE76_015387 [Lolium multiflorum]
MPGAALSRSRRSSRSWGSNMSSSIRHQTMGLQPDTDDPFRRSSASSSRRHDDEENLRWAALEKLPTYDRMRRAILLANHDLHDLATVGSNSLVEKLICILPWVAMGCSQDQPPCCPRSRRTAEKPGAAAPAPNSAGNAAPTRVATPIRPELQSPDGERPLPNTTRARAGRPAATVSRAAFER